ncbi:DUF1778 domain-containing protein [Flammeovirga sp. MY04]|uniref:type II toxin-antitoxin system TacA family antitoxin n=1 Tax=Flammeovirga sp. MY04 TaxID=1191459 RepID=UPI0008060C64|nr:DUF1778 domain-containing protein [Flammeovirga sp. MY04]ANQ48181.1 DUF1778 domain-containing protein [Flammeovirga sp. MY04]
MKTNTIRFRVDDSTKEYLESIAALEGNNLSEFIISSVLEKAKEIENKNKELELENTQFNFLMQLLKEEPKKDIGKSYENLDLSGL